MVIKKCKLCKKPFKAFVCHERLYCSSSCSAKSNKTNHFSKNRQFHVSKKARKRQGEKMKQYHGIDSWNWKGNKVGIKGVHSWLRRMHGKARSWQCQRCHKQALDWASKDHKYRRNRNDFMPLCRRCHAIYDITMGFRIIHNGNRGGKRDR